MLWNNHQLNELISEPDSHDSGTATKEDKKTNPELKELRGRPSRRTGLYL